MPDFVYDLPNWIIFVIEFKGKDHMTKASKMEYDISPSIYYTQYIRLSETTGKYKYAAPKWFLY